MNITSVTVGLPVTSLQRSWEWYAQLLQREPKALEPVDGVLEWDLGPVWLQIFEQQDIADDGGVAVRFGVDDLIAERDRLQGLGLDVTDIVRVEGTLEFADLTDPDGHLLTIYRML